MGYQTFTATNNVAPFAGAWIEIDKEEEKEEDKEVAPFAGAWIEMQ